MISGTSKIWSKSGPGELRIITKMAQEIQEKIWNHPGKILSMSIWDSKQFGSFQENVCPMYNIFFDLLFSFFVFFVEN